MNRSRFRGWALGLLAVAGTCAQSGIAPAAPTPTPTPRPKLSGGFGRARATPVAPAITEGGQSLADVVRAAQGAGTEKSGVTIDNRSLVKNPDKGRVSTAAASHPATVVVAPPPVARPATDAAGSAEKAPADAGAAGETGGEAEWKEIAHKARKKVDDGKTRVGELAAAEKKLETDFYAWDDGQYRDRVIKPAWDRTRSELEDARRALAEAEKELADLPERARRAGALPGWIRE